jgi:tRNA(adenine34) deaminase
MATKKATKKSAKKAPTKKSVAKKSVAKKSAKKSATPASRRWSAKVTSDSTHPSAGLFKKSPGAIADEMLKPSVSPNGPGQAMQMLSFYENRAGKNLPAERKQALEKAKDIVREREEASASKPKKKK